MMDNFCDDVRGLVYGMNIDRRKGRQLSFAKAVRGLDV